MRWGSSRQNVSICEPVKVEKTSLKDRRALQIAISVILQRTERFEVDGPLQYVRMPEMGIMSCPLRLIPSKPDNS